MHRHHRYGRHRSTAAEAIRAAADAVESPERTTTRVQLEMPPQSMERLQRLKEKTEAASYAEVIRNAVRVFEALLQEHEAGAEFLLKRPNGETVSYKIFV
ncbi:MAG: ribbon-helix-helix protein, CopG family [Rhizomicrobium sp.]